MIFQNHSSVSVVTGVRNKKMVYVKVALNPMDIVKNGRNRCPIYKCAKKHKVQFLRIVF